MYMVMPILTEGNTTIRTLKVQNQSMTLELVLTLVVRDIEHRLSNYLNKRLLLIVQMFIVLMVENGLEQ